MRVFLDTNVLISAFAARGLCADQMRLHLAEHEVLTGEVNLVEQRRVLTKRVKATAAQVDTVEQVLRDQTIVPKPAALLSRKVRDADDAWVLAHHSPSCRHEMPGVASEATALDARVRPSHRWGRRTRLISRVPGRLRPRPATGVT